MIDNPTETNAPLPRKRRVLLFALAPVVLLILLTAAIRLVSEAAERQSAHAETQNEKELKGFLGSHAVPGRPIPQSPPSKPADTTTQKSIETAVRGQISAIQSGDYARALTFSVPGFRAQVTPEYFGQLIRNGYSPMLDAKKVSLNKAAIVEESSGAKRANVETVIQVSNGNRAYYTYMLVAQKGTWGVQGVVSHPAPQSRISQEEESGVAPVGRKRRE